MWYEQGNRRDDHCVGFRGHQRDHALEPKTIERRSVGSHDELIDIDYAGICHYDITRFAASGAPSEVLFLFLCVPA